MATHAPQNPLESDDQFYEIMGHSHGSGAEPKPVAVNAELDELEKRWQAGKIAHRDYEARKFAIERSLHDKRGEQANT